MNKCDIPIAVMLAQRDDPTYEQIADELEISPSTAHAGVARLRKAGLVLPGRKKTVARLALLEFLEHGLRYVFPVDIGATKLGVPTAHSAPALSAFIDGGDESYVWASRDGSVRGRAVEPLLPRIDSVAQRAPDLYASLSLVDALRVGRVRERQIAARELRARFNLPAVIAAL